MISAVSHAVNILRLLSRNAQGLTANDLIQRLRMEKSVASRVLATLEADGLVTRSSESRYTLSLGFLSLTIGYLEKVELSTLCLSKLNELAQRTGETVMLAVVEGHTMVYVAKAEGGDDVRVVPPVGDAVVLHASSVGKAWLASLNEEQALQIAIKAGLRAVTPQTITTVDGLRAELRKVRERGYATVRDELISGASSVGVAVHDDLLNKVTGALVLVAPSYRLPEEKFAGIATILSEAAADFIPAARINKHQALSSSKGRGQRTTR